jgi:hypothetical protein
MNEKNILMACDHPFVLNLICTYNTNDELLMLTELLLGGELWSYIYEKVSVFPIISRISCISLFFFY